LAFCCGKREDLYLYLARRGGGEAAGGRDDERELFLASPENSKGKLDAYPFNHARRGGRAILPVLEEGGEGLARGEGCACAVKPCVRKGERG